MGTLLLILCRWSQYVVSHIMALITVCYWSQYVTGHHMSLVEVWVIFWSKYVTHHSLPLIKIGYWSQYATGQGIFLNTLCDMSYSLTKKNYVTYHSICRSGHINGHKIWMFILYQWLISAISLSNNFVTDHIILLFWM